MRVITARNVGDALIKGLCHLYDEGVNRDSRNGSVRVFPGPVTTHYKRPTERVIFFPERDANPYFHFMESLWMLDGRRDVAWVSHFSTNIKNYSDDGVNFHGAYGYRWRKHFTVTEYEQPGAMYHKPIERISVIDQLEIIAHQLKANPDDRRIVLQMWDAPSDLGMDGKDFPCNLIATFRINPYGNLDMTVFNRSNDMIWGAYGANAVHFSVLQEVMAAWIGVPVGEYWQISTNFHAYADALDRHGHVVLRGNDVCPYHVKEVEPFPIVNTDIDKWFSDLRMFMDEGSLAMGYNDRFFKKVAVPMLNSWNCWKTRDDPSRKENALRWARDIQATDWRKACVEWLERRS